MFIGFATACNLDLNIGSVAIIGDSVAAGCGARSRAYNPVADLRNYNHDRGVAAITGGDSDAISIISMAQKHSNVTIEGKSIGTRFNNFCRGWLCVWPLSHYEKKDGLNMAQVFLIDLEWCLCQ